MDESLINKLFVGNALTKLKHIDDDCIDLVITSPPYWNAVVYDKDVNTDYESYLNNLVEIFSECTRVLRPNGKLAINTLVYLSASIIFLMKNLNRVVLNKAALPIIDLCRKMLEIQSAFSGQSIGMDVAQLIS